MSRHRNVRNLDFHEEQDFDDVYGRSLEEEVAVSPATAAQFLYPRDSKEVLSLSSYMKPRPPPNQPHPLSFKPHVSSTASKKLAAGGTSGKMSPVTSKKVSDQSVSSKMTRNGDDRSGSGVKGGDLKSQTTTNITITKPDGEKLPAAVRVTSSSANPKMGFITPQDDKNWSRGSSPTRSPSPSSGRGTPNSTPSRQPQLLRSTPKNKHSIDVLNEYKKRQEMTKPQINLVVIGHVDAGKSTLMGHLLFKLGQVSKKTMHKYEQESQKIGKASFMYAWVLDETGEERSRGVTMDIAQHQFETERLSVNLLDAPGHRDFIPNMITGAAQADVAVLVVDSTTGEFESGFESGGQTREHALLVRSLGVTQLVVAVNKMDMVDWSEGRFDEIVGKLKAFLKTAGFKESDVRYVPCSGLTGENLLNLPTETILSWYKGPTLSDCIDKFSPPVRPVDKPLRCCLSDIFKGQGGGVNISGKIESGHVQHGETVLVLPANDLASVRGVSVSELSCRYAVAGDQVVLTLNGIDPSVLTPGSVLCSPDSPVRITTLIRSRIIIFDIDTPITIGYPVLFHHQSVSEPANIKRIISQLNKSSGEIVKKKPRCLTKNCLAIVEVELTRPVCVELYQDCKELGRFMLRYAGKTIAAGIIIKIL